MEHPETIKLMMENFKSAIRSIVDFPKEGIVFRDLTTAMKEPALFMEVLDELVSRFAGKGITKVVGVESRGFIYGGALAARLGAGFVPVRKPGKLPAEVFRASYQLEYGEDVLEVHKDAIGSEDVVLVHDDLLATGGTAEAVVKLMSECGAKDVLFSFLVELDDLDGRKKISDCEVVDSLMHF